MGICDNADKVLKKPRPRKRKTSHSTGRNAGHRYRANPDSELLPCDWEVTPGGHYTIHPPATPIEVAPWQGRTDRMWDTHGYIQNWMNPCIREKIKASDCLLDPFSDGFGHSLDFKTTSPSSYPSIRASIPFLSDADLDELALKSNEKLSQVVDLNVSVVNFILELIEACEGNVKILKRFRSLYGRMLKAYREAYLRFLRQGHKEAAARWLAWNFAIKPFISDLKGLLCSVSLAYKKLKWLQDHNHKIVVLRYSRKDLGDKITFDPNSYITGEHVFSVLSTFPVDLSGAYHVQTRYIDIKVDYNACSKIFLDIPDDLLDGMKGMGALWSAMQGLYNPVGIIWEAIPFSWLIDYFLSYRARLFERMYDMNPYNLGVHVLEFGHMFRLTAKGDQRLYNITHDGTLHDYGAFTYELYSRQSGLPTVGQTTLFRVPSDWYHFSIIAALLTSSGHRR